jgi:protein SCO1/2
MKRLCNAAFFAILICAAPAWADAPPPGGDNPMATGINSRYLLMDTRGRSVSDQDFPGRFQLIAFGYTFCPDICPTTLAEMAVVMEKLGKQSERLQPLFVSVDPERDTPEILRRYTEFFHPRIIGLTGSPELVRRVANNFKVIYAKHWEPGAAKDKYSVDHSAGMYLLGPDGSFVAKFAYATPPQEVAERIRVLMLEDSQRTPVRRTPSRKAP